MIFISYRKADTQAVVDRLADRLKNVFGNAAVFKDDCDLHAGERWPDRLRREVLAAEVLLVVIVHSWLTALDGDGRRRLDDPEDWVRQEISTALESGKRVFVLLVDSAKMPTKRGLPPDCPLQQLPDLQTLPLRSGSDSEADLARLIAELALVVGRVPTPAPSVPTAQSLSLRPLLSEDESQRQFAQAASQRADGPGGPGRSALQPPVLSLQAMIQQGLLRELAQRFRTEEQAADLLTTIGFPASHRPPVTVAPITFWRQVCEEIEAGTLPHSELADLLAAAAERFPGNPVFRPWARGDARSAAHGQPGCSDSKANCRRSQELCPEASRQESLEGLDQGTAVYLAYSREIDHTASLLRAGLSVLVHCDKVVTPYLWGEMARKASLRPVVVEATEAEVGQAPPRLRQRVADLRGLIQGLGKGEVLVLPHLDLLAGGPDATLAAEAREVAEVVFDGGNRLLLAFADSSLIIPDVLAARFAGRKWIQGLPRQVVGRDGTNQPVGAALVTADEAAHFRGFDPDRLYPHISGMNPVRLRQAIAYAVKDRAGAGPTNVAELYQALRHFKVQSSVRPQVPDVSFDNIGGYDEVKALLGRTLGILARPNQPLDARLRRELMPRGFIFHGPVGTGKTLFAKAVANFLSATIQAVFGPEVADLPVNEGECKLRDVFVEARRNAPSVVIFHDFDALVHLRDGREGRHGGRNAVVAQLLAEIDGFIPDVLMLLIGITNRLDLIDESLLRPGRFQPIQIGLPTLPDRLAIARIHGCRFRLDVSEALLQVVANGTEGFSGDEIQSLFRDAYLGKCCEDPPIPPDAHRFGMLVGRILHEREQRAMPVTRGTSWP
jgi:AAA+ superfamily predicted ATPase